MHIVPECTTRHREVAGLHQKVLGGPWGTKKGSTMLGCSEGHTEAPGAQRKLRQGLHSPARMHTGAARLHGKTHGESWGTPKVVYSAWARPEPCMPRRGE